MKKLVQGVAIAVLALAPAAQASTLTFNSITAEWVNGVPAANVTTAGANTAAPTARWGTPATSGGPQSGYNFNAAATPFGIAVNPPPVAGPFNVGTFTHLNNPIFAGTSITSIQLKLNANLTKLSSEQAGYIGVDVDGPYKTEQYRY